MSDGEGTLDPIDSLEAALLGAGDELVRAYVTRLGGTKPRVSLGRSLELRRDLPLLDQLIDHIQANANEGGGVFEVKLKLGGDHLASGRVPIELPAAPPEVPADSAGVPRGSSASDDGSHRRPNPSPVDPIDELLDLEERWGRIEDAVDRRRAARGEGGDADPDDGDPADEEEGATSGVFNSLIKGAGDFVSSETGQALAARLGNGLTELVDGWTEAVKAKAGLYAAQAAGKVGLGSPAPIPEPKIDPAAGDSKKKPTVVRIEMKDDKSGGQAA